jgi:cytoskeletal protein RodZ
LPSQRFSQTLGEYLKREREARNVSLEEISHATRINRPFLEALERGDFNFFSRKEFVLGFLKRYARFLSLDEQEILRRFTIETELAGHNNKFEQIPLFTGGSPAAEKGGEDETKVPEIPRKRGGKRRWRVWLQLIILTFAISLTVYLNHLIKGRERVEERSQREGIAKKGEQGENEKKKIEPERVGDLPSGPNRLKESDQAEKKGRKRERPDRGKSEAR